MHDSKWRAAVLEYITDSHAHMHHVLVDIEYTAHHDFGYSRVDATEKQGARFATLLLYLNEGMKGGETNFPRWANGHTFRDLRVTPKSGKAVLFYSQLPDGNLDDFSQHAALPVTDGEKVGPLFVCCALPVCCPSLIAFPLRFVTARNFFAVGK
jgi:2OG-Fe(II) oxygenase superfamily